MRAILSLVLLAGGFLLADEAWQTISSARGKFSVRLPGKPKVVEVPGNGQWTFKTEDGKAGFITSFSEYGRKIPLDGDLPKKMLDSNLAGLQKSLNAKLISSKDLKFNDKFPARDIELEVPSIGLYRLRIILTEERMYQIVAMGPKEFVEGQDARSVRDSFKLAE
jgi:hypothetical protein